MVFAYKATLVERVTEGYIVVPLECVENITCNVINPLFFRQEKCHRGKYAIYSYIPRSKNNTLNSHKRWNDSWVWLLSSVLQHALLCGNRLLICFCHLNSSIYLLKCMMHIFSPLLSSALVLLLPFVIDYTMHWAVIKRSNPVSVTINYSNHRSHILVTWITVKIIVTLPQALKRSSAL